MNRSGFRVLFFVLCLSALSLAATYNGTLSSSSATLAWSGTETGVIGQTQTGTGIANPPCNATICDLYNLTVNVPSTFYSSNPNYAIHVTASWAPSLNEIDVYVYDANNNLIGMSTNK